MAAKFKLAHEIASHIQNDLTDLVLRTLRTALPAHAHVYHRPYALVFQRLLQCVKSSMSRFSGSRKINYKLFCLHRKVSTPLYFVQVTVERSNLLTFSHDMKFNPDFCIRYSNLRSLRSMYGRDFSVSDDTELLWTMQRSYIIMFGIKKQDLT